MAIEKMKLLNLVGALDEENSILQELVLCESVHFSVEQNSGYDNSYIMHEYEAMMPSGKVHKEERFDEILSKYQGLVSDAKRIYESLKSKPGLDKEHIKNYDIKQAMFDLKCINELIGPNIEAIEEKRKKQEELIILQQNLAYIYKNINFTELNGLNYFEYEIGMLSRENRMHIKKNYENISAVVFEIGNIEESKEDIYIVLYLKTFRDEIQKVLKSLNWNKLNLVTDIVGSIEEIKQDTKSKLTVLEKQITRLEKDLFEHKDEHVARLNKIYTRLQLELKIIEIREQLFRGNSVFVLSAWIKEKDFDQLEACIANVTDKYVMIAKNPEELDEGVRPPTSLENHRLFKPFEMIVQLYGLPNYGEIDPTPFLAITFCLMFGIMFGDVGQGLVYFLAGFAISKKIPSASGILKRLGLSSMLFGLVYGSVFGLEEIPILEEIALVHGGPLNSNNIMPILIAGMGFGVAVLTVSFVIGIINAYRRKDVEEALFSKNGVAGYIFFMGLIVSGISLTNIISLSVVVPVSIMIIMLIIMVFKEPLAHLVMGEGPTIHGDKGSYYIESGFEGVETILSTLSNALSFIRVGAFALNHAGLFLAFSVMAEMTTNIVLKIIILALGNILILTLEGLVVFIQGLRLQYYEMFSKYFGGDGLKYNPIKLED